MRIRIRDGKIRIRDKHLGSATLLSGLTRHQCCGTVTIFYGSGSDF
jgi:hypothetical protein